MLVEVKIVSMIQDQVSNIPIVILSDGNRNLPIWIGTFEAQGIISALQGKTDPRPITYDLMKKIIDCSNLRVVRVIVSDLRDGTFYAILECVDGEDNKIQIDARPSDCLALAVRVDVPIFVSDLVFKKANIRAIKGRPEEVEESKEKKTLTKKDKLEIWLKNLKPEDFKHKV